MVKLLLSKEDEHVSAQSRCWEALDVRVCGVGADCSRISLLVH